MIHSRRLRATYRRAITSLERALEARDAYTWRHSLRVRSYALRLADAVGLERRLRRQLGLAAKLHDIGKIALSDLVLNKTADLTPAEEAAVREHPANGERILAPVLRSRAVLAAVRGHHERFDGQGYPDGLAGERIPLLARLLTIADCFDALTSSRTYREALSRAQAAELLRQGAGSQFDPALVPAFIDVIHA
jgi:HD-GYP domain-containing protein (c-di-GMP phosphodiesterase class II)